MEDATESVVRYRRNLVPGATFFFTVALADRRSAGLIHHISTLRLAIRRVRSERPFGIDAIVVLPDHLHAIFTLPEGDANFSHSWRRIKTVFTQGVLCTGEALGRRDVTGRSLWQRRFWEHTIRNDADFSQHVDYIHYNPTKHGLASIPSDWPYSSLHRFIREGIVALDWGGADVVGDERGEPHSRVALSSSQTTAG
jgi:putative transposase